MKHVFWLVLVAGCAGSPSVRWLREDVHPVAVKGDRHLDRVRLWSGDSTVEWRNVLVTRDSISGIPVSQPEPCQDCRRTLPASAIDSLSVGYRTDQEGRGTDNSDDVNHDHDVLLWTLLILAGLFCP